MAVPDDQWLVSAARSGDDRAFAELIGRHYRVLLGSCERMLGDRDLARDAAQEATVRAMLGLGHLRDETRFRAWLVGIGLNVCRGLLMTRQRQTALQTPHGPLEVPAADAGPLDLIVTRELADRVRAALSGLPAGQREAVALFYLRGLTQAEAAEELGTRPGAIKTRLHKARRSLRDSLKDTYEEYITMNDPTPQLIPMQIAELRRAPAKEPGVEDHIVFLQADDGQRLPIWIGQAEATAMALILEQVQLPRPGVYQFAASLLTGAGARLREVHVNDLTESTFYARAILSDDTSIDARPSDALTLALISNAPIYVAAEVLKQAERTKTAHADLIDRANAATDDARVIADDALASYAASLARLSDLEP